MGIITNIYYAFYGNLNLRDIDIEHRATTFPGEEHHLRISDPTIRSFLISSRLLRPMSISDSVYAYLMASRAKPKIIIVSSSFVSHNFIIET